jgi:DNA (cytosine-5)-methyltransferase 1
MAKRRLISFTGAGGLDLRFEAAGFETAAAVEIDEHAVALSAPTATGPSTDIHTVSSDGSSTRHGFAPVTPTS